MTDHQVLITGAGPTGCALACGLASQGIGVRLIDRAPGPSETSRANILHARGAEVLVRLGALGDLRERSLEPVGMRMHVGSRPIATMRFLPDAQEDVRALFVSQALVEQQLRRRLRELGVEVEWGVELSGAVDDGRGVDVRLGDEERIRVDWLVGCDGARSTVRDLAGIDFDGVAVGEQFLLADVHAEWDRDRAVSAGFYHRDGLLLAIPMRPTHDDGGSGDLWRLMADVSPLDHELDSAEIVTRLESLLSERANAGRVRISRTAWTSVFRIHRRLAKHYRNGRILLAGDAAHIHSPIGGQGMNTGIGDAENLAWKLALVERGRAEESLLDTYQAERRPLAEEVLANTTRNTRVLLGESAVARLIRNRLFVPMMNLPTVQRHATRVASQLWVSYRRGPLGGGGAKPRAGDRVADRDCLRSDGVRTRLYEELAGWALLAHPGTRVDRYLSVARDRLGTDVRPLTDRTQDGSRSVWLIRPDGHLGWRGHDPESLERWLVGSLRVSAPRTVSSSGEGEVSM